MPHVLFVHLPRKTAGFTLLEIIIGMMIFAIGLTGIYALLSNTMMSASYSRHEIIVANLLREQMELIKNIRDTNIRNFLPWNQIQLNENLSTTLTGGIYLIENNFSTSVIDVDATNGAIHHSPVSVYDISHDIDNTTSLEDKFRIAQLVLDEKSRYVHRAHGDVQTTPFASYIIVKPMEFVDGHGDNISVSNNDQVQGFIIDARVIVNTQGGYREYDARTALTDWIQ